MVAYDVRSTQASGSSSVRDTMTTMTDESKSLRGSTVGGKPGSQTSRDTNSLGNSQPRFGTVTSEMLLAANGQDSVISETALSTQKSLIDTGGDDSSKRG